ncbi:protein max isoform X1 [Xenopus laevis]|uniref:Protein max isoform X1 n=1 Tax=Xenopus laevis TaxID=8355 RepID=A0A8J1LKD9_XENLA|nr:protein max isoform X1 [Xenopus laevis]XP_041429992.1 protein max isoform X1 [Xenopus laevis]
MLSRDPAQITAIPRIVTAEGAEHQNPDQILEDFACFYSELYRSKASFSQEALGGYLDGISFPKLSRNDSETLNQTITSEEVLEAIAAFPSGKSPGPDGLPMEWYKAHGDLIAPQLTSLFNDIVQGAPLPITSKLATVVLILKEGKPPENCGSYRPISLLNSDIKILAKILANRLKLVIEQLIHPDQTGFMPNKGTDINIRRLYTNISANHRNMGERIVVSLDTEKAFDTIEWSYLWQILSRYELGNNYIAWVKALYDSPRARVRVNSGLTGEIPLARGTRQGCPLSPLLFALAIEPLAIRIRSNPQIVGLQLQRWEEKLSLYADDMLVYLADPRDSLSRLLGEIAGFGDFTGLRVNWGKSLVFPIDSGAQRDMRHGPLLQWVDSFRYLGIEIHKDTKKYVDLNLTPLIRSLKLKVQNWANLPLSLPGRINILKLIFLPKLLYAFHNSPVVPPRTWFRNLDAIVRGFIWAGERPRIGWQTLQAPVNRGGLSLPNFLLYFYASQLVYAWWWLNPNPNNQAVVLEAGLISSFEALANQLHRGLTSIYDLTPSMKTVCTVFQRTVVSPSRKRSQWSKWSPLWGNETLIQLRQVPDPATWASVGIRYLGDVVRSGEIKQFEQLKEDYGLQNRMLFRFLQLRHALAAQFPEGAPVLVETTLESYLRRPELVRQLSWFYALLLREDFDPLQHFCRKWQHEFPQLNDGDWKEILCQIPEANISSRDRYIQSKFLNRVYLTPHRLARIYPGCPDVCPKCNRDQGTYKHVFWDCPEIQRFWGEIMQFAGTKLGLPNVCSPELCLLGITEGLDLGSSERICLLQLVHFAKKAILMNWKATAPPSLRFWKKLINNVLPSQKLTYQARGCPGKFGKIWNAWLGADRTP